VGIRYNLLERLPKLENAIKNIYLPDQDLDPELRKKQQQQC
jgi:hypothetical protein